MAVQELRVSRFFTSDAEVTRHCLGVLDDLVNNPELCNTLAEVHPLIENMVEISGGRDIRSITIGVNLDAQIRSVEAGVVSISS